MAVTNHDYGSIADAESLLIRFVDQQIQQLLSKPHKAMDLIKRASIDEVNSLQRQYPVELWDNPNLGAGTDADEFREPGSTSYAALYIGPVRRDITGGIGGDRLDNLMKSGTRMGNILAMEMGKDMQSLWCDMNAGFFRGNTGERGIINVASVAIAVSGGISTVYFDDNFGVKHIKVGGRYEIFLPGSTTQRGVVPYRCLSKDMRNKRATFSGDLTTATIGSATGDIMVNKGTYLKDFDSLIEMLGTSGWYGGLNRDELFQVRGNEVDASSENIGLSILEKADTVMRYVGDGDYDGSKRTDLTSPTQYALLTAIGYSQKVVDHTQDTYVAGFKAVKYKDRMIVIDRDCNPTDWWMLDFDSFRTVMLREFGLAKGKNNLNGIYELRGSNSMYDKYFWVHYGKGNRICVNPRRNLRLKSLGTTGAEVGHV